MIGEPSHQPSIEDYAGKIAKLVEMHAHNDPILQDQLEQVLGPPF
jgi:hypothetical protein